MLRTTALLLTVLLAACSQEVETVEAPPPPIREIPTERVQVQYSYAPLVERVAPAVVNVYAGQSMERRRSPYADDPFFERFFGRRGRDPFGGRPPERMERSLGSGVLVDPDGLVVTNVHVIANADTVLVATRDGREYAADVVTEDVASDIAVLKLRDATAMPFLEIGDADALEVGDLVLAVGNPFGVGQTVTSGIVSGLARSRIGEGEFGFFIQTDAAINPGNSGGALVGMGGRLVGINTAIFSRSGGSNGIGFAVPANMVNVVVDAARKGRRTITRPYIGAMFQAVTYDIAESLGLERPTGALVAEVFPNSPAERVGLRTGDVVLRFDDRPIQHLDALGYRLTTAGVGREVTLDVLSGGKERELALTLEPGEAGSRRLRFSGRSPFAGATVADLSVSTARRLRVSDGLGVVVTDVERGSIAARVGLRPNDIVIAVNGSPITDLGSLRAMASTEPDRWLIDMVRDGRRFRRIVR